MVSFKEKESSEELEYRIKDVCKSISKLSPSASGNYLGKSPIGSEEEYGIIHKTKEGYKKVIVSMDKFLPNGGRVYLDLDHPEYATPESGNPLSATLYDKVGEKIIVKEYVEQVNNDEWRKNVQNYLQINAQELMFFKHNIDSKGNTFGFHENYGFTKYEYYYYEEGNDEILLPFFISRIIFGGSGSAKASGVYKISQKAHKIKFDGIYELIKNESQGTRWHITSGDANMSEPNLFLKFSTSALVLDLFKDRKLRYAKLNSPSSAFCSMSRDLKFKMKYGVNFLDEGKTRMMTAIDIQRLYHRDAEAAYRGRDKMTDCALDLWGVVLEALNKDPIVLKSCLDWVIKKNMLDTYAKKKGISFKDPKIRLMDSQYHLVDKGRGLFYILQSEGKVERLLTDEQIAYAEHHPPHDTRAKLRGELVALNLRPNIIYNWDEIVWFNDGDKHSLELGNNYSLEEIKYIFRVK